MSTIKTLGLAKDLSKPAFVVGTKSNRKALSLKDGNYAWVGKSDMDTDPKDLFLKGKIYSFISEGGDTVYGVTTKALVEQAIVFEAETVGA